jgi:hypothetical protein
VQVKNDVHQVALEKESMAKPTPPPVVVRRRGRARARRDEQLPQQQQQTPLLANIDADALVEKEDTSENLLLPYTVQPEKL